MTEPNYPVLHPELSAAATEFRSSLVELLAGMGATAIRPTELSRRFGLDKSLAWKLSMIEQEADPQAILELLPGYSAVRIFLRAMERSAAETARVDRLARAADHLEAAITLHTGDRATLELVLDAAGGKRRERLETSRKLAFRGNSGIWGVQAKARVSSTFLFPVDGQPGWVSSVLVSGWVGFRRLRPEARWVIFRHQLHADSQASPATRPAPLDPDAAPGAPFLLRRFCTGPIPEMHVTREGDVDVYELGRGPVGNAGAFTCFTGNITPQLGRRHGDAPGDRAHFSTQISAPCEHLAIDLFVHRDLKLPGPVGFELFGLLRAGATSPDDRTRLPLGVSPVPLLGEADLSLPAMPNYGDLVRYTLERLGQPLSAFEAHRAELAYPPFPTTAMIYTPLLDPA